MLSDGIIERNAIFLRNLNTNATQAAGTWVSGTGYGFYSIPYEKYLILGHYYFLSCYYKFTTTNQSPTWFTMYFQGGGGGGPSQSRPVANTEYRVCGIRQPIVKNTATPISSGTMYNGENGAISGVTSYVRAVMVYDVTELYYALLAKGTVTSVSELETWCTNNLAYNTRYTNYNVSSLISDSNTKICMKDGTIVGTKFVEPDGMRYYSASTGLRDNTYFDSGSGISVYNNNQNGTVTHTRISASGQSSPFYPEHQYILQITTNGSAAPGTGGFVANHNSAANKIFVEKFVAKIPVGYTVNAHYNTQGTGASVTYLTARAGTGNWEEYGILYKCGSSGGFSNGGHVALSANSGYSSTSVTWYLAYVNNCEITTDENLKMYSILPTKTSIKGGHISTREFDDANLVPDGDGRKQESSLIPSGWSWDTSDVPVGSKAVASIVQPVGAGPGDFGKYYNICPTTRYKLSYWVKCKADMTSFLSAIFYYTESGAKYTHENTIFVPGTKTTLTAALTSGATQMTVASNANWGARSYSKIGFRSGGTWSTATYNDLGQFDGSTGSTGIVKGVSGSTIVTLNTAYTGATRAVNTVVVESYDGSNYPYPIAKGNLPTDNTWKYVEGYFGAADTIWEGASTGGWIATPGDARKMILRLNLYSNNGSVPIKYADIRITPVSGGYCERYENKIQLSTD